MGQDAVRARGWQGVSCSFLGSCSLSDGHGRSWPPRHQEARGQPVPKVFGAFDFCAVS